MSAPIQEIEAAFLYRAIAVEMDAIGTYAARIKPDDFSNQYHAAAWEFACKLQASGRGPTPETMAPMFAKVAAEKGSNALGDSFKEYVKNLFAKQVVHASADHYAKELLRAISRRRMTEALNEAIELLNDDEVEPDHAIAQAQDAFFAAVERHDAGRGSVVSLADAMDRAYENLSEAARSPNGLKGISTGINELDKALSGLIPSFLYIIAARPAMGKTAFAMTLALNAAMNGKKVLVQSLEMSSDQLGERALAFGSGISTHDASELTPQDFVQLEGARQAMRGLPIFIDEQGAVKVSQIKSRAMAMKRKRGLDLLLVDYLGLISPDDERGQMVHQIAKMTSALKALAKELNIPVLLLCQLNRSVEQRDDKRPMQSDLRDSGAIEQDADVIIGLYREIYYLQQREPSEGNAWTEWASRCEEMKDKAEVLVLKRRQGPISTVVLKFDGAAQAFVGSIDPKPKVVPFRRRAT